MANADKRSEAFAMLDASVHGPALAILRANMLDARERNPDGVCWCGHPVSRHDYVGICDESRCRCISYKEHTPQ